MVPKENRAKAAVYGVTDRLLRTGDFFHMLVCAYYSAPTNRVGVNKLMRLDILVKDVLLRLNMIAVAIDAKFVALSAVVGD